MNDKKKRIQNKLSKKSKFELSNKKKEKRTWEEVIMIAAMLWKGITKKNLLYLKPQAHYKSNIPLIFHDLG